MSQYTISLKSIINIKSHLEPYNDDVFADTAKKIERGREIFFNFDYPGDAEFKELFETAFIIKNLTENIYCLDVDLFMLALKNDVLIRAPYFYKRYQAVKELNENDLSLGDKITHTSERSGENENKSAATNKAESSNSGKSKSSQFPQDIVASAFGDIKYMDGGTASDNSGKSSGSNTGEQSGTFAEHFSESTQRDISKVERLELYLNLQRDIITEFVNSFNNLFMLIW